MKDCGFTVPDVKVTIDAVDADRAARRLETFCLLASKLFCFHFNDCLK